LLGIERNDPSALSALEGDGVIEMIEDFLIIHSQTVKQRRNWQLALAVDTDIDDVFGVEFKVEPRTTIRNDACGK